MTRTFPGLRDAVIGCGYAPIITILGNLQLQWVEDTRSEMTMFAGLFQSAPDSLLKTSKSSVEIKYGLSNYVVW